jgi:hypothetical protein
MQFGTHLHELWRLRVGVALAAALALLVAASSVYRISVLPPSLHARQLQVASASTRVLIDAPRSKVVDLRAATQDFNGLTTRADLLGNVMASPPVREFIARRAKVSADRIATSAPITANVPRVLSEPGSERRASDLLQSTDQYRIDVQANPSVPILDVYTQAPTPEEATRLANGAVDGLRDYLGQLSAQQGIQPPDQVKILQMGRARGGVVNDGVGIQIAVLAFVVVFMCAAGAVLFLSRIRRGWREAAEEEREDTRERDRAFGSAADAAPVS